MRGFLARCSSRLIWFLLFAASASSQPLRLVTYNCWTGLDYRGNSSMGEYESRELRDVRLGLLVRQLRESNPDLVALQEVNPAGTLSQRIADSLAYDVCSVRVNGGMKIGPLGFPTNLDEGIAILARRDLDLHFVDVWDLSNGFGLFGDGISLHWNERNAALVARVVVNSRTVYVLSTHLTATAPDDASTREALERILHAGSASTAETERVRAMFAERSRIRLQQIRELVRLVKLHLPDDPVILMGDLNAPPEAPEVGEIVSSGFVDGVATSAAGVLPTWDPARNTNVRFSIDSLDARRRPLSMLERLGAWYDREPRRIDHVFLGAPFTASMVRSGTLIGTTAEAGVYASDHYGVQVDVDVPWGVEAERIASHAPETEFLPILSYDTDVGFGYGVKFFLLNRLGTNESFDIVAFNSTKGERWYRLVFSTPDLELRQGRPYPLALDVILDCDTYIRDNFFGVGYRSRYSDREIYSREPFELSAALGRGWASTTVSQVIARYRMIRNFHFEPTSRLAQLSPPLDAGIARLLSLTLSQRYDTRNSFINPSQGIVLRGEVEHAFAFGVTNVTLTRGTLLAQAYTTLLYPRTVFAIRGAFNTIDGSNLPVQVLLPMGGTGTLRGSPNERFLDRVSGLLNAEIRFPIVWRFGGVVGMDAGKVWGHVRETDLKAWSSNPVVGLRLYMDTFVVRADLGFGAETTGFYLNFGQLF